jgi:hypothetical protein
LIGKELAGCLIHPICDDSFRLVQQLSKKSNFKNGHDPKGFFSWRETREVCTGCPDGANKQLFYSYANTVPEPSRPAMLCTSPCLMKMKRRFGPYLPCPTVQFWFVLYQK